MQQLDRFDVLYAIDINEEPRNRLDGIVFAASAGQRCPDFDR